jgi:hypothetical protein
MIYGIKQIEKQFPGFEARWTGGMVFDLRELFDSYKGEGSAKGSSWIDSHKGFNESEKGKLLRSIQKEHWDLMRPPSEKMYILHGRKPLTNYDDKTGVAIGDYGYVTTEYAIKFGSVKGDRIFLDEVYCYDFIHKEGCGIATRHKNIWVSPFPIDCHVPETDSTVSTVFGPVDAIDVSNKDQIARLIKDKFGLPLKNDKRTEANSLLYMFMMLKDNLQNFSADLPIALFFLNVRNIKQKTSYFTKLCGHYYPKVWGREYKILSLSQTLTEQSPGPNLPPGYRVRGHFCKGHFKRKPHGVYWWNPHWRGDFSKGIVMKDYKVKASAGPTA